jgi:hypothetical protein
MFIKYDREFSNKTSTHSTDFTRANTLVSTANTIMKIYYTDQKLDCILCYKHAIYFNKHLYTIKISLTNNTCLKCVCVFFLIFVQQYPMKVHYTETFSTHDQHLRVQSDCNTSFVFNIIQYNGMNGNKIKGLLICNHWAGLDCGLFKMLVHNST